MNTKHFTYFVYQQFESLNSKMVARWIQLRNWWHWLHLIKIQRPLQSCFGPCCLWYHGWILRSLLGQSSSLSRLDLCAAFEIFLIETYFIDRWQEVYKERPQECANGTKLIVFILFTTWILSLQEALNQYFTFPDPKKNTNAQYHGYRFPFHPFAVAAAAVVPRSLATYHLKVCTW